MPTPLDNKPELALSLEAYYDAFLDLSGSRTHREMVFKEGKDTKSALIPNAIPFTELESWLRLHLIPNAEWPEYCFLVGALDAEYIGIHKEKLSGKTSD